MRKILEGEENNLFHAQSVGHLIKLLYIRQQVQMGFEQGSQKKIKKTFF